MEDWQKEHIVSRLPELIELTICSTNLLATFRSEKVLVKEDVDNLDAIKASEGETKQKSALFDRLMTKRGAYNILVKALFEYHQAAPGLILLEGYEKNNQPCPFDLEKEPFVNKDGFPILYEYLTRTVLVQGKPVRLLSYLQRSGNLSVSKAREHIDAATKERILSDKSIWTLIETKIPKTVKDGVYIKRTLMPRVYLTAEALSLPNDIFLVTNIERNVLANLANGGKTAKSGEILGSLENETSIKVRHILLDKDQHKDFDAICKKAVKSNLHLLSWEHDALLWIRSHGTVHNLLPYLHQEQDEISEEEYFNHWALRDNQQSFCISGTAGMGKSVFLEQLADFIIGHDKEPSHLVFFFTMGAFLDHLPTKLEDITADYIKDVIAKTHTSSKFGHFVLVELLGSESEKVSLFLDGYDELLEAQMAIAAKLIRVVQDDLPNIRLLVTTRPNLCEELERHLGVFATVITPLTKEEQVTLLVNTWQNELQSKSEQIVYNRKQMEMYATKCIEAAKSSTRDDQEFQSNTGEPLQCMFLGEINSKFAARYVESKYKTEQTIVVSTKNDMFKRLIQRRFQRMPAKQLSVDEQQIAGKVLVERRISLEKVKYIHVLAAIELLFPEYLPSFQNVLSLNLKSHLLLNDVLRLGIILPTQSSKDTARFTHRSVAEYLLAEYIAETLLSSTLDSNLPPLFTDFLFDSVLSFHSQTEAVLDHPVDNICSDVLIQSFFNPDLTYFLNSQLASVDQETKLKSTLNTWSCHIKRKSSKMDSIWGACARGSLKGIAEFMIHCCFTSGQKLQADSTILLSAARFSDSTYNEFISKLLRNEKIVLVGISQVLTPVQVAVQRGNYYIVDEIISRDDTTASYGRWLLHLCVKGSLNDEDGVIDDKKCIITRLMNLKNGTIDIQEKLEDGSSALLQINCHTELLKHMLEFGADVNDVISNTGESILHVFLQRGKEKKIEAESLNKFLAMIKSHGYEFSKHSRAESQSALFLALKLASLNAESLNYFKNDAADFEIRNEMGENLAFIAIRYHQGLESLKVVMEMVFGNTEFWSNTRNVNDDSLIHIAVEVGNLPAVEYLLSLSKESATSCITLRNKDGNTALHVSFSQPCMSGNQTKIQNMLLVHQADLLAQNKKGLTPIELGLQNENLRTIAPARLAEIERLYNFDLSKQAGGLLKILFAINLTSRNWSNHMVSNYHQIVNYLLEQIQASKNNTSISQVLVEYNGVSLPIKDLINDLEIEKFRTGISTCQDRKLSYELWTLANSSEPCIKLVNNMPLSSAEYFPRTLKTMSGDVLTEEELVSNLSQSSEKFFAVQSSSVGVTSILVSLSRKIQRDFPKRVGIYIDASKFQYLPTTLKPSISLIIENTAPSRLAKLILEILMTREEGSIDLFIDGIRSANAVEGTIIGESLLVWVAQTFRQFRVFAFYQDTIAIKFDQIDSPTFFKVIPFSDDDLSNILASIWTTKYHKFNSSDVINYSSQYVQQLKRIYDSSPFRQRSNYVFQHILYLNLAKNLKTSQQIFTSLRSFVFALYQSIVLDKLKDFNQRELYDGFIQSFSSSSDFRSILEETDNIIEIFVGSENSNTSQFIRTIMGQYIIAKVITELISSSSNGSSHPSKSVTMFHSVFYTNYSSSITSPKDLGVEMSNLRIPGSTFQTFLFENPMHVFLIDGLVQYTSSVNQITCQSLVQNTTPKELYEVLIACLIHQVDNITKYIINGLQSIDDTAYSAYFLEEERYYHLLLLATKHATECIIEIIWKYFHEQAESMIGSLTTDTLILLHVAGTKGNFPMFKFIHQNIQIECKGRGLVHSIVLNSVQDSSHMIQNKRDILKYLLAHEKAVLTEKWNGLDAILTGKVHVDLIEELMEMRVFTHTITNREQNLAHLAATYMNSEQFEKFVIITKKHSIMTEMFGAPDSAGKTPLHYALQHVNNISLRSLEAILQIPNFEPFSITAHKENSLFFVKVEHQPIAIKEFIFKHAMNYFLNCDERNVLLDDVTAYGNEAIVTFIFQFEKRDMLKSRRLGNTLLHLSAIYHCPERFHEQVAVTINDNRIDKLAVKNNKGYTPLHEAIVHIDVQERTIKLLKTAGVKIYTIANDNKSVIETASNCNRSESLLVALKESSEHTEPVLEHTSTKDGNVVAVTLNEEATSWTVAKTEAMLREYVTEKSTQLIQRTTFDAKLMTYLKDMKVFEDEFIDQLMKTKSKMEKTKMLYARLSTNPKLYGRLAKALSQYGHTSVVRILLDGLPLTQILQLKLRFNSSTMTLKELWHGCEQDMWERFRSSVSLRDLAEFGNISLSKQNLIQVTTNSLPSVPSYYIRRSLVRQVKLTAEDVRNATDDVFVIQNIVYSEFIQQFPSENCQWSSSQTLEVTAKFIILEDISDWHLIYNETKVPIHLLRYSGKMEGFLLEESHNGPGSLKNFCNKLFQENDKYFRALLTEEEIVSNNQSVTETFQTFCIVDLPGSGKSALLGSLAKAIEERNPDKIIAHIYLPLLCKQGSTSLYFSTSNTHSVRKLLVEYITTSSISASIVIGLLDAGRLSIELFLDGLDEVPTIHSEHYNNLVKTASKIDHVRVHMTLSPERYHSSFQSEMLSVHHITPLSEHQQKLIIKRYWSAHEQSRFDQTAETLLENVKSFSNTINMQLFGIPLHIRVLSEIHLGKYFRNMDPSNQTYSLASAYKRFVERRFLTMHINIDPSTATISDIFKVVDPAKAMVESIAGSTACYNELAKIKAFHVWKAIDLLFPSVSDIYASHYRIEKTAVMNNPCSVGLLQQKTYGDNTVIEFIHSTFTEYLISELIRDILFETSNKSKSFLSFQSKMILFLFEKLLETKENRLSSLIEENGVTITVPTTTFSFQRPLLVYFLNEHLEDFDFTLTPKFNSKIRRVVTPAKLFSLLNAVASSNYAHILNFVKSTLELSKTELSKYTSYFSHLENPSGCGWKGYSRAIALVYIAAKYSTVEVVGIIMDLFQTRLSINLENELKSIPFKYTTPLHFAISRGNIEMVDFFIDKIPIHDRNLLRNCIEFTHQDSMKVVHQKRDILKKLVSKTSSLLHERGGGTLTYKRIHLVLIKELIRHGADLTAVDGEGNNIIVNAATYLGKTKYHELIDYIATDVKASNCFAHAIKCPIHKILQRSKYIDIDHFRKLLNISGANMAEKDADGNNLILCAIQQNKPLEFIDALRGEGVSVNEANIDGEIGVHFASKHGNMELIRYFSAQGISVNSRNFDGKTCIHYAGGNLDMIKYLIQEGADISARDDYDNNIAHFAATLMEKSEFSSLVTMILQKYTGFAVEIFNRKNKKGRTPIHERLHSENEVDVYLLRSLLKVNGVDANAVDEDGNNFLQLAVRRGFHVGFLKALVEHGVDCRHVTKNGSNVLHEGVAVQNIESISLFVDKKVSVYQKDSVGETPLQKAQRLRKIGGDNRALDVIIQKLSSRDGYNGVTYDETEA